MELGIIAGMAFLVSVAFIWTTHRVKLLHLDVQQSFRHVDAFIEKQVALHARWARVVAAYDLEAQGVLAEALSIQERFRYMKPEEKIGLCDKLDRMAGQMKKSAEKYPKLRTAPLFIDLCEKAGHMKKQMPAACEEYNLYVSRLNKTIELFPANVAAWAAGIEPQEPARKAGASSAPL